MLQQLQFIGIHFAWLSLRLLPMERMFFWHLDKKINYCNLFQRFKRQKFRHFVLKMLRLPPERFLENTLKECLEVSWMRDQTESTLEGTLKNQFLGCWQDLQESCRPEDPSAVQLVISVSFWFASMYKHFLWALYLMDAQNKSNRFWKSFKSQSVQFDQRLFRTVGQ